MKKKSRYFPVVLSAPSGGGKTAIREKLLANDSRFCFSVTCTTRPKRPGEREGRDYYFVTKEEFCRMRAGGELLEWARVHGNMYGTPAKAVRKALEKGLMPVMTIDVKGARAVKKIFPETVTVFLLPPDLPTLVRRLKKRGEPEEGVKVRFGTARSEMKEAAFFDYLVVNDKLDKAARDIQKIADTECLKVSRRQAELARFGRELLSFKL